MTLTPNFTFPIRTGELADKTMTASESITYNDIIDGKLKFIDNYDVEFEVISVGGELYRLMHETINANFVTVSGDVVRFGASDSNRNFTRFEFNP